MWMRRAITISVFVTVIISITMIVIIVITIIVTIIITITIMIMTPDGSSCRIDQFYWEIPCCSVASNVKLMIMITVIAMRRLTLWRWLQHSALCSCDDGDNKDLTFWSLEVDAEAFWRSLTNCSWWKSHLLAYNMDMRITDKNVNWDRK